MVADGLPLRSFQRQPDTTAVVVEVVVRAIMVAREITQQARDITVRLRGVCHKPGIATELIQLLSRDLKLIGRRR